MNPDAIGCCLLHILVVRAPGSSRETVIIRFEMPCIIHVLLFCSSRVHSRRADVIGPFGETLFKDRVINDVCFKFFPMDCCLLDFSLP